VNVRAGGQSRLSAISHAIFLLLIMLCLASVVSFVPLAALAGVLFATTARMVEPRTILALVRSTRGDAFIVLLTFTVTVLVDLVTAVGVGLALAIVLALRDVARSAVGGHEELDLDELDATPTDEERALLRQHIVAYRLDGPLVFAAAHQMLMELPNISGVRAVIIRMSRVTSVDATGAHMLADTIRRLEARGIVVLLSGVRAGHVAVLEALGADNDVVRANRLYSTTDAAIAAARGLVCEPHVTHEA
jgi:SulP family sulfate permease